MATIRYYRDTGSVLNKSHAYDCVWKKIKIRSSVQSACEPGPVGILIRYPAQIWGVSRRRLRDLPNAYRFREAPGYHPGWVSPGLPSTSGEDLPGVRGNDRTPEILIMRTESANRSGWVRTPSNQFGDHGPAATGSGQCRARTSAGRTQARPRHRWRMRAYRRAIS